MKIQRAAIRNYFRAIRNRVFDSVLKSRLIVLYFPQYSTFCVCPPYIGTDVLKCVQNAVGKAESFDGRSLAADRIVLTSSVSFYGREKFSPPYMPIQDSGQFNAWPQVPGLRFGQSVGTAVMSVLQVALWQFPYSTFCASSGCWMPVLSTVTRLVKGNVTGRRGRAALVFGVVLNLILWPYNDHPSDVIGPYLALELKYYFCYEDSNNCVL